MKKTKTEAKISKVMREYKEGTLHSGKKGPVVKSKDQAIAIALSQARKKK
jgi:ribosomal protein L21E